MYHPITTEFLSKSQQYNRARQCQVHQLHNSFRVSRSACPSKIQKGMDLLGRLLMHAGTRFREAKITLQAKV